MKIIQLLSAVFPYLFGLAASAVAAGVVFVRSMMCRPTERRYEEPQPMPRRRPF
jgi:hypothetical protein